MKKNARSFEPVCAEVKIVRRVLAERVVVNPVRTNLATASYDAPPNRLWIQNARQLC